MFRRICPSCWVWLVVVGLSAELLVAQGSTPSSGSWLNRPAGNWNVSAEGGEPSLPWATVVPDSNLMSPMCSKEVREAKNDAEADLVRHGWKLYGDVQTNGTVTVVMGMTDADGMCRPLGYQAFVFAKGRYAGTLSPVAMDSRADGALSEVHFVGTGELTANFLRYKASDPLCCASGRKTVEYKITSGDRPVVEPVSEASLEATDATALEGRHWVLRDLGAKYAAKGVGPNPPDLTLDAGSHRASGSSGCNRYTGSYELSDEKLAFGQMAGTMRACAGGMDVERDYLQMLGQVKSWKEANGVLTFFDVSGKPVARYHAAPKK